MMKYILAVCMMFLFTVSAQAQTAVENPITNFGPDTFGYTVEDVSADYTPITIDEGGETTQTIAGLSDGGADDGIDDGGFYINLPENFSFQFYNTELTGGERIAVSTNSFISFNAATAESVGRYTDDVIPNPSIPNAAIYAFWTDTVMRPESTVTYGISSGTPRKFVINFNDFTIYSTLNYLNLQIVLVEGTNNIYINILNVTANHGGGSRVGIEDESGTDGIEIATYDSTTVITEPVSYAINFPGTGAPGDGYSGVYGGNEVNGCLLKMLSKELK